MTSELRISLKKIVDEIKQSKDYQDYLKIENKMKNNEEIICLIEMIKDLQKQLVKNDYYKKDLSIIEEEYNNKLEQLNSYPLYQSYLEKQKKVNEKLQYVKTEIQCFFDEITLS